MKVYLFTKVIHSLVFRAVEVYEWNGKIWVDNSTGIRRNNFCKYCDDHFLTSESTEL